MPAFIPGLELSKAFYSDAVKPIIDAEFPRLNYTAGLIGPGSEVLGFDTEMSTDHCWGPRLIIFLRQDDLCQASSLDITFRRKLPAVFRSYSTNSSEPDPTDNGTWHLEPAEGEINHAIQIETLSKYILDHLGVDINNEIESVDWLTLPEQKLRTLSPENLFHDDIGSREVLDRFAYYPHDVRLYLLAAGWNRIGQEEHLMGRAGSVGDEIGSAIIASRLVRDLMRLCFLMEREYAPYPKWFGTAFARLRCATDLLPIFTNVLTARVWKQRESHLVDAYEYVAAMHNYLRITEPMVAKVSDFFGRPFKVIHLNGKFSEAITEKIKDPVLKELARSGPIGGIDQISDNTDLLSSSRYRNFLSKLYT